MAMTWTAVRIKMRSPLKMVYPIRKCSYSLATNFSSISSLTKKTKAFRP